MLSLDLLSIEATENLARDCARYLPSGTTILLSGPLAAGKTVFARAFIRALLDDDAYTVPSPTFNLVHPYFLRHGTVYHYDLYRVGDPGDLVELGLEETPGARATLIEWPERLGAQENFLRQVVRIDLQVTGPESRVARVDFGTVVTLPDTAFVFAAGLGERMRPLTSTVPKPLVPVAGRPILGYGLETLKATGVSRIFMNTHYLAEQVNAFAARHADDFKITLLYEPELLETGGGLMRALPEIGRDVFFVMNGDALVMDRAGAWPYTARLAARFDPDLMDILLLLYPVTAPSLTPVIGDYDGDEDGRLIRRADKKGAYMFTGARILHRRVFEGAKQGRFSFLEQMDQAQEKGRLFGQVHTGTFHHLSTPHDVQAVTDFLSGCGT